MKKYILRQSPPDTLRDIYAPYSPLLQKLLYGRGLESKEDIETFLYPDYEKSHDPFLLAGMKQAVGRIMLAMEKGERIAVFSDYDADGIPGAVALSDFFKKIAYPHIVHYIPLRNEEGFGLNVGAIESLAKDGVTLLITIDCGISNVEEVRVANTLGVDVIITDHHLPHETLPEAYVILNPKQTHCTYPEKMLCGAGVIFKLIQALVQEEKLAFPKGHEKWFLDMVGLATLSDMVPLFGENRTFALYGLKVLQKSPRVGLNKLLSLLKIDKRCVNEDDVGFMITPRINAASRMGIPLDAFTLLSTTDEVEAGVLATLLDSKNNERKGLVAAMIKDIKKKIEEREDVLGSVLVFGNPEWKPSLLGLVANSFSDEHKRPVFLWGREGMNGDSVIKGSCRSGNGISVVALMEKVQDVLLEFGGHSGAGGFSLLQKDIYVFEERLNAAHKELLAENKPAEVYIDSVLHPDDITFSLWNDIVRCAPFGFENPKPVFLIQDVLVQNVKMFGKEKNHLEFTLVNSRRETVPVIAFFQSAEKLAVSPHDRVSFLAHVEKSTFGRNTGLRLRFLEMVPKDGLGDIL